MLPAKSSSSSSYARTFPNAVGGVPRLRGNRVPPLSRAEAPADAVSGGGGRRKAAGRLSAAEGSSNQAGGASPAGPADSIVVSRPERDSPAFHLAVQALQEGCVQAFIRFFALSHRAPVCVDELAKRYFAIPDDRLAWVQARLSAVEVLRRESAFREVLEGCAELAVYFEAEGDFAEAAWHLERGLAFTRESLDAGLEQAAREGYAGFLERRGRLEAAAAQYEAMARLARAVGDDARARAVGFALVGLYQRIGERALRGGRLEAAREYFRGCALRAQRAAYGPEEGSAYEALGHLHEQKGQLHTALAYQKNFRVVSQRERQFERECQAIMNVASLEDRMGDNHQAISSLKEAVLMARELRDPVKIAKATMHLGEAYRSKMREEIEDGDSQDYGNTVTEIMVRFAESFEAARESGDTELIDSARVLLGFARGSYYFKHAGNGRGYPDIVCNDVRAQLKWMSTGEL